MIHPKALIDKEAALGNGVEVGAYAIIEKGVVLGKSVVVSPFAYIKANTSVGDDTFIGSGAVIGEAPQMIGITKASGRVYIGKNNIIREYVTINCSMSMDKSTTLGDNNFLMAFSHIAHDCKLANNIVVCNGSLIAGHVEIADKAFISGNVGVHQFVRIGKLAMVAGLSRVNQDVPPFMMVVGDSSVRGINSVGLKRADFTREDIRQVKEAHNFIYRKKLALNSALANLEQIESDKVKEIVVFILSSKRGICGSKRSSFFEKIFLDYPYFLRTKIPAYDLFLKAKDQRPREFS